MSFQIAWDDLDQQVIRIQFDPPFEWAVVFAAYSEMRTMMDSVPHQVHWITDMSAVPDMPAKEATKYLRQILASMSKNAGMNVVVISSEGVVARYLLGSFARVVGWQHGLMFASSVDAARDLITSHRLHSAV